jgi:predicted NACHT family NTPase
MKLTMQYAVYAGGCFMNSLFEELERLKVERTDLIKELSNLDKRISILAEEVQKLRSSQFREKHKLEIRIGDIISIDSSIRAYAQSHLTDALNPIVFTGNEAKVIGYDYENDFVLLGSDIQDPAPIRIPIVLIKSSLIAD